MGLLQFAPEDCGVCFDHSAERCAMFVTFRRLGRRGRLGNQLFQIAATIGVARRNQCKFVFPRWDSAHYFANPVPQSRLLALRRTEKYREQSFLTYQPITIHRSTCLDGNFQSAKYFDHCADEVRHWFAAAPALAEKIRGRFQHLLEQNTCSVHVRRGDYINDAAVVATYIDLTATGYYQRAIEQFGADTKFLVFSDDIAWCKQRFPDSRFVFIEGQQPIEDLFLMSLCRGNIIANSTFSWWAAWLNQHSAKKVLAPQQWFKGDWYDPVLSPDAPRNQFGYLDTKDMLPSDWLRIPLD
jgi:hypothetical protein